MIVFGQALIRHIRDSTDERWQCKVDEQKTMPRMRHVFEFVQCNSINLYAAIVSTLFFHFLFFVVYLSTRDLPAENAHAWFRTGWIRLMTGARACIVYELLKCIAFACTLHRRFTVLFRCEHLKWKCLACRNKHIRNAWELIVLHDFNKWNAKWIFWVFCCSAFIVEY